MTPKTYLDQLNRMLYEAYAARETVERIRSRLDVQGIRYDTVKVQSSRQNREEILIAKLIKAEEVADEKLERYEAAREVIADQIEGMDGRFDRLDKAILYMRYVDSLSLQAIAKKLCYTYDYMRHRHGTALRKFGEKYPNLSEL